MADEDKVMDQHEYDKLLRAKGDASDAWELQASKKTVDDIIEKDFKLYLYRAKEAGRIIFDSEDPRTVMNKLELLADDGIHLLNAGALLFCRTDLADVQMAKFATDVKATFLDIRREDFGSIIGQSEICIEYIKNAIDWKADIIGTRRVETPEIPVEAIREAIINSYGHRMYNNGQNNEIDVFKDRIEIHTTGGFPEGHTPEEFFDGDQKPIRRNRLITRVLYFSKDMETFATGLMRIKDLCDEAGCNVDFQTRLDDFVVVFHRNLRDVWSKSSDISPKPDITPISQNGEKDILWDDMDRDEKILDFCSVPRSRVEIQEKCGYKANTYFKKRVLDPLIESGKLVLTIPETPNHPRQKYVRSDV